MRRLLLLSLLLVSLLAPLACGSSGNANGPGATGTGGTPGGSGGAGSGGAGGPPVGEGGPTPPGSVGQVSGVTTSLPPLPVLANVAGTVREDSVGIDFHPFDGAADYRVYVLPKDSDISVQADGAGAVVVKDALYRCAGLRQTTDLQNNLNKDDPALRPLGAPYNWKAQVDDNPTLGHVYLAPGADRTAVYAVAGNQVRLDGQWRESRYKLYTTDEATRQMYLGQKWRDDGIVFYVPTAASDATHTIYSSQRSDGNDVHNKQYYFAEAARAAHTGDSKPPQPAFQVLNEAAAGTQPLMAVQYLQENEHTELAVGNERFKRAAYQGNSPLWHVEWAGITAETTLVVEALASGCPFQGFQSPQHVAAPPHQTLFTLDELRNASATGEVFINGQYDTKDLPRAIARSFVKVAPKPHDAAAWDFYEGFNNPDGLGPVQRVDFPGCNDMTTCGRWQSKRFDFTMSSIDNPGGVPLFAYGAMRGQLWTVFDDWKQDVTGKVRFTALEKASVDADHTKFLHVTWSTDIVGTDRRYPQLIISDQDAPVQTGLANPNQNSLLIQTIDGPGMRLEAQAIHGLVKGTPWDVNNQATSHVFLGDHNDDVIRPIDPIFEHAGMDRQTTFDAYVSSDRLYVYFDGLAAGCTLFPAEFKLGGPVTVTIGDVLYHEGAEDEGVCQGPRPYTFLHAHQCTETRRHFDDLGWKSGVKPPAWDEAKFPCLPY